MAAFNSEVESNKQSMPDDHSLTKLSTSFFDAFECSYKSIFEAFGKIDPSLTDQAGVVFSIEHVTSWKNIFKSYMENLHLDQIHDSLNETITAAVCYFSCVGFIFSC